MLKSLQNQISQIYRFSANRNQIRDLKRLFFEIMRREQVSCKEILKNITKEVIPGKYSGRNVFFALKKALIKRRFPLTSMTENIDTRKVFSTDIQKPLDASWPAKKEFTPLKIVVEKDAAKSSLLKRVTKRFPDAPIEELAYYSEYLKKNKYDISQLKEPLLFIVNEKWDFIKRCPCTKGHLRCGYWIFNLGFGCPFDCSYCFLQHYANFPGIILPANLDDFFDKSQDFFDKIKRPIRIGTGEFCDSLALDDITEYSLQLIPYFKNKNVTFELKTKSDRVDNLLKTVSAANIVISWSLNPPSIIETEELATADLGQRLQAARAVQEKGYRIGFHFDPIIHCDDWQSLYQGVVKRLYGTVKPPFAWISLGTLRCNRQLKSIVEQRFPKSNIFYGELLMGDDKKLRYPEFLRLQIYKSMLKWIRSYDKKTPVYLCMESKDIWGDLTDLKETESIENYILKA